MDADRIMKKLEASGARIEEGLQQAEINRIEAFYNIQFPPDLKTFLMLALPVSNDFVDWRDEGSENIESIQDRLNWPLEGLLFDVERNAFWMKAWGKKPALLSDALAVATHHYNESPKLIPVFSHRYIPSSPFEEGNPIFSVHQTDIIYYSKSLSTYLMGGADAYSPSYEQVKRISFWSDIVERWDEDC